MPVWLILLVLATIVIGGTFALSVLTNWFTKRIPQPSWVTTRQLVLAIVITIVGLAIGGALTEYARSSNRGPENSVATEPDTAPSGPAVAAGAGAVAPDLSDRLVLTVDDSAGSSVLFSSWLDGSHRQRLWDTTGPMVFMPDSTDLLMARYAPGSDATRLEVRSIIGDFVRTVTTPPPGFSDASPTIARAIGTIFFVRSAIKRSDEQSFALEDHVVMRVPLDGSSPPEVVPSRGSQVHVYRVDDGTIVNLSGLPGRNDQPVWARESEHPCLLFRHDETGTDSSVYLGCLTPEPRTQPAIPVGQHPLWFEPSAAGWTG